ncbi:MAG: hypothetical protein PHC34_04740 [Candidatus Gastranaerophilales bacterium]|nr:hypothetical protein [Candidatus Gastranaerophilales bacterium]
MTGITNIGCRPLIQNNYSAQSQKTVGFRGSEDLEDLIEALEESKKSDKPKDREFDINKALSNFGKGFISPVTTMFSSATNFVVGAGTLAICVGLMKATKNKLGPALVVAGTLYGGLQAALGIKKAIKAENNAEREKAFFDIGAGAGVLTVAAVAAKPTLEAAGLEVAEAESLSITKSTIECFKNLPKSFSDSVSVLNDPVAMTEIMSGLGNKGAATAASENIESGNISRIGHILVKPSTGIVASTEESITK